MSESNQKKYSGEKEIKEGMVLPFFLRQDVNF